MDSILFVTKRINGVFQKYRSSREGSLSCAD